MSRLTAWLRRSRHSVLLSALGLILVTTTLSGQDDVATLKERIVDVQNATLLGIRRLELSSDPPSYGRYTPIPGSEVAEGSVVYLYIEPDNLYTVREDGRYHVEFVQDLLLIDQADMAFIDAPDLVEFFHDSVSPLLDIYAENRIDLEGLPPGTYRFIVTIHDLMGGDSARGEIEFTVVSR